MKTSVRILTAFILGTTAGVLLGRLFISKNPKEENSVNGCKDHEGSFIHKFFKEKKRRIPVEN